MDDVWRQVWPEGYIHPDDLFYRESWRSAGGRWDSSQKPGRDTVSHLIWPNRQPTAEMEARLNIWMNKAKCIWTIRLKKCAFCEHEDTRLYSRIRLLPSFTECCSVIIKKYLLLAQDAMPTPSLQTVTGRSWVKSPPGSSCRQSWVNDMGR